MHWTGFREKECAYNLSFRTCTKLRIASAVCLQRNKQWCRAAREEIWRCRCRLKMPLLWVLCLKDPNKGERSFSPHSARERLIPSFSHCHNDSERKKNRIDILNIYGYFNICTHFAEICNVPRFVMLSSWTVALLGPSLLGWNNAHRGEYTVASSSKAWTCPMCRAVYLKKRTHMLYVHTLTCDQKFWNFSYMCLP